VKTFAIEEKRKKKLTEASLAKSKILNEFKNLEIFL